MTTSDDSEPKAEPSQTEPCLADELADSHLRMIEGQVDAAKDASSYESYWHGVSPCDRKLSLFIARRKGTSHVIANTPCQDYCLATSVNGCTVLADADGVSSCEHGDIGARLACAAVVDAVAAATKTYTGDEELSNRLLSVSFRERLVSFWVQSVMDQIGTTAELSPEDKLKEFMKYGSTIMFAVLTEKSIVVGNIGDGQVLVFNDHFGVKLRVHAPKFDSRVRCLVNEKCARDDFQVAKYPRACFNGVLLSSDGMYESLDKGNHFFNYSLQLKERFLGRTPHEPYLAFCYKEEGEPFKDFSRMRTQDDCSIAMALDDREVASGYDDALDSVAKRFQAVAFKRWSAECASFFVRKGNGYADVVAARAGGVAPPAGLKSAVLEVPEGTWSDRGFIFSEYADSSLPTIEFMHCSGQLRRDKLNPCDSERRICDLYLKIKDLQKELAGMGLELNSSAIFNMAYDGKDLHIRREALGCRMSGSQALGGDGIGRYFSHLLGILVSAETRIPVFDIGYVDRGIKLHRARQSTEDLAQLLRIDNVMHMKNVSTYFWILDGGQTLPPGESLELPKRMRFALISAKGEEMENYCYIAKELL